MILSDEKNREFWNALSVLKSDVNGLKGLFQNNGREIKTEDYAMWNMDLAKVFKGLQDMQLKFAVAFTSGDKKD